ncbi:MAG TPA: dihydrodipicolinate synthase family protein [Solirubrobacteraceae bacterium]|nr:dihydrodipicolinate synthase family protein [Solirubrobacteraceae bacterium]
MTLSGIMPAVTTPFDVDGRIDERALRANLRRQLEAGVTAIVALGTMGEGGALSVAEREQVLRATVDECGDRPVVAGVSADGPALARAHAEQAARAGAVAVTCLPPVSYDADLRELIAHYEAVAQAGLPIMVYNNPGASHSDLRPETIVALGREVGAITCVKECSGDARRIAELLERTDGSLDVLVGGDNWALEGFAAGAHGWVSGCANPAPRECVALWKLVCDGDLADARELYMRLLPLARLDMSPKLVQYYKAALDEVGAAGGPVRPPRMALLEPDLQLVREALAALRSSSVAARSRS